MAISPPRSSLAAGRDDGAGTEAVVAATSPAATPSLAGLTFSVVPHTHWDREWYLPFEVFRLRLVTTVEEVLDVLEADDRFAAFTLDGQAAIVDDVLDLRPDLRPRVAALARAGRLAVGPAYVLPDEFLVGGETHVRNLLAGRAVARALGAEPMAIGYQPDPFGHVAQMPQLLRGFGLDGFVFWRGMGDEVDRLGPVFRWVGADGSWVYAIRQLDGYGGGSQIGRWVESGVSAHDDPAAWPEGAAHRFVRFVRRHAATIARGGVSRLTLANGGDHHRIQADLPDLLAAASAAHPGSTFVVDRYDRYLDRLRPDLETLDAADPFALGTVRGELLGAREAFVLRGVNSARMPIKQAHERTELGLLVAETLASLAHLARGRAMPREALGYAWRELLRNAPHDSVTGCSTDAVHEGMLDRYRRADQVTDRLRAEALAGLVGREAPWEPDREPDALVSLVNPLPVARRAVVRVALPPHLAGASALVGDRPDGLLPVQAVPADADAAGGDEPGPAEADVLVDLPPWGATSITLRRGTSRAAGEARAVDERTIESDRFRLRFGAGAFELADLRTGRSWERVAWLEDVADRGDEYTFRGLDGEVPWTSLGRPASVRVTRAGPWIAELEVRLVARLPRRLAPGLAARSRRLVRVPVVLRARLVDGVDRVELELEVDNRAEDHRLRLRIDDPESATAVRAAGQFAVLRRAPGPRSDGIGWHEAPEPTDHMDGFVAAGSLAVLAPGLPEYQALPRVDGGLDLAVTLLRCVGRLGRDLPSRAGGAGPAIATPGAQCPGRHRFRVALLPTDGLRDVDLVRAAQDHRVPVEVGLPGLHRPVPVRLEGDDVAFSTLKPAEDGAGVVLRCWNPGPDDARVVVVAPGLAIARCRLDETPLEGEADPADAAETLLGPAAIGSWRIR